jgi:hypothetical protein
MIKFACESGDYETVKSFIDKDIKEWDNILSYACKSKNEKIVELILKRGFIIIFIF